MKKAHLILIIPLLLACTGEPASTSDMGTYDATWESVSQFPKSPEFFLDAKFGIYTHWGPVTVASDHSGFKGGGVQWHGMRMYQPDNPVFAYHEKRFGDQHEVGYKEIARMFKGEKFDAEEWAEIFASSGARFAGPVAIHHDNYAMWDSEVTPWNSMDMAGRDFTGELAKAIKAKDMMYLTAFHHSFTWDYFQPSYEYDAADGTHSELYCEPHGELDPPTMDFLDTWHDKIMEVVTKYEPDMIWFDFGLGKLIPDEYQLKMFADYYNWAESKQQKAVVFHKHEKIQRYTGVLDFERGRADKQTVYPWLTDTSLGPWFHDPDHPYYSTDQLIDILLDIISKNGCMLLNVGPKVDGSIPEEAQTMLAEMGQWLKVNGEGVFETRPWTLFGEGPTRLQKGGGFNEKKDFVYTDKDIRFTRSKDGKTIYAFVLDAPSSDQVLITSFKAENGLTATDIESAGVLGGSTGLSFRDTDEGLMVDLPGKDHCDFATGIKFHLK